MEILTYFFWQIFIIFYGLSDASKTSNTFFACLFPFNTFMVLYVCYLDQKWVKWIIILLKFINFYSQLGKFNNINYYVNTSSITCFSLYMEYEVNIGLNVPTLSNINHLILYLDPHLGFEISVVIYFMPIVYK